jgi:hypothetical protein
LPGREDILYLSVEFPTWVPDVPLSSFQLLIGGGALLILAGLMLGLRRTRRVSLERSLLTDEVILYLSRIADALERNAPPSKAQIIAEIERHAGQNLEPELSAKVHTIPYSLLGREHPESK